MKLVLMSTPNFFVEEHHILTALFDEGLELVFYKSKKSDPSWMEIPCDEELKQRYARHLLVACSYADYQTALNNDIPERWWRFYNKLVM